MIRKSLAWRKETYMTSQQVNNALWDEGVNVSSSIISGAFCYLDLEQFSTRCESSQKHQFEREQSMDALHSIESISPSLKREEINTKQNKSTEHDPK